MNPPRCTWCQGDPLLEHYHDTEWGVPVRDDRLHFEHLALEAAQAGLSWRIVLSKRPRYREVFRGFDPEAVARMGPDDVERLLQDAGIVRNRRKIEAILHNARPFLDIAEAHGSFARWLWAFTADAPVVNRWTTHADVPATTPLSDRVSKALKQHGFRFVGSTVIYAHLQATGLVNDHLVGCFRHGEVGR